MKAIKECKKMQNFEIYDNSFLLFQEKINKGKIVEKI